MQQCSAGFWQACGAATAWHAVAAQLHSISKGSLVVVKKVLAAEADVVLCAVHVVLQRAEGHLRLNHPEFSQVAACVAVCRHSS